MDSMIRMLPMGGVLLLVAARLAMAESPLPDPVAPAVVGRPLDQIGPVRPARPRPAAAKTNPSGQVAAGKPAAAPAPGKAAGGAPAAPRVAAVPPQAAAPAVAAAPATQPAPEPPRVAKQAVDDRVDPRTRVIDNVGQGTRMARKPLQPGAYLGIRHQALVRQYYRAHPAAAKPAKHAKWKIGEPVPPEAAMTGVPDEVRARLPALPPGHQYVQLDGEVVLVAVASRMVVDGVSRDSH